MEKFVEQLDESDVWSVDVGQPLRNAAETFEYRRLYQPAEQRRLDDVKGYAEAP